jgi:hypothetical protein
MSYKEERLKELRLQKRALIHAYVDGKISYKEYLEKVNAIDNEIKKLEG